MPPMCLVLEADIPNASVQIKEGSITNKDVVIQRVSTNLIGKTGETTAAAGNCRVLQFAAFMNSLWKNSTSRSLQKSSGKLSQLHIYRLYLQAMDTL